MLLIQAWVQVLRLFVVGMRWKSGPSRNPFVCRCSHRARPDRAALIGGLHRHKDKNVAHGELYI